MSTTLSNRYIVDLPEWRALSIPLINTGSTPFTSAGIVMAPDMRCRDYASPHVFFNLSGVACSYNFKFDAWNYVISLGMAGTQGQGANAVFCPSFGPSGTISAGATTRSVTLTTALPAAVLQNQMANRGDGLGFIVRIIGNAAGSSGKIEERRVIANTSGTTPTIYFDKPLSFTPVNGDRYEFLSGSVLFLNTGTLASGIFRRYDLLTNTIPAALSTTGFIATVPSSHNQLIALDEQYVPHDRNPGEGYLVGAATYDTAGDFTKGCLTATAATTTSITGQASGGDDIVVANQFRNYQIRIVEDTTTPTAVGQRRRIISHTAGPSPVYTISSGATNWTVTPSSTCKFVIENDTDKIIGFVGGTATTYNYNITANTWDTTTWSGARAGTMGNGALTFHTFGISANQITGGNVKHSNIISFRGTSLACDVLDIAGGTTGLWSGTINTVFNGNSGADALVGAGDYTHFAYNPHTQGGRFMYTALGSTTNYSSQRMFVRFDGQSFSWSKVAGPKLIQGNNNITGTCSSHCCVFQDGNTKVAFYNTPRVGSGSEYYQLMLTF